MKQLKLKKAIAGLLVALSVVATVPMQAHAAWQKSSTGWWNSEGSNGYSVGWRQLDGGAWFYFNTNGYMQTNWKQIGGSWYYFGFDGAMVTGWLHYGSDWFYLNSNGTMAHDTTIGGYYLGSNGAWTTPPTNNTSGRPNQRGDITGTAGTGGAQDQKAGDALNRK